MTKSPEVTSLIDVQRAYKDRYVDADFPSSCAFCEYRNGRESPLNRRGHVISGFIYKAVRDALKSKGREINSFQTYDQHRRLSPTQDGIKFKHLCDDCENEFGETESRFLEILRREYSNEIIPQPDTYIHKFCLSIAWRIIYSNFIRQCEGAAHFRAAYTAWLREIPRQMMDLSKLGAYDTYFFSGRPAVQELTTRIDHKEEDTRSIENDYLFSIRQVPSQPEIYYSRNSAAFRQSGPPVLYVQLGAYHFLFTPAGYFSESIVSTRKLGENFFTIPNVRDMKALGDIFGKIRPDDWCRDAYLERFV